MEKYGTELCTGELANIFPIGDNQEIVSIEYNDNDNTLLVFMDEAEGAYLYVLEATSGKQIQKLRVAESWKSEKYKLAPENIYAKDSFIAIRWGIDWQTLILEKDEKGLYSMVQAFTPSHEQVELIEKIINEKESPTMAYKDGKLACVYAPYVNPHTDHDNRVKCVLVVWDKGELAYVGEIDNSLDGAYHGYYPYKTPADKALVFDYEPRWK